MNDVIFVPRPCDESSDEIRVLFNEWLQGSFPKRFCGNDAGQLSFFLFN